MSARLFSIPAAVILVGVSAAAIALGVNPIRSTIDFVTDPYSPTAERTMRNLLPAELAATCDRDYVLIPGNTASVVCHDADTTTVSFHAFGTATDLDRAYGAATGARGIAARADDRQQELYSNWSTGKYRLRSS